MIALLALAALVQQGISLTGISEIGAPGIPGSLALLSDRAHALISGKVGSYQEAVVATSEWRRGRVVAFAHEGYLSTGALEAGQTWQLFVRAVQWAGGNGRAWSDGNRQISVLRNKVLATKLAESGFQAEAVDTLSRGAIGQVVVANSHGLSEAEIELLKTHVSNGGGLVTSGLGWGWLQLNPGKKIYEHPGNRLLHDMGLMFTDSFTDRTSKLGYAVAPVPAEVEVPTALDRVRSSAGVDMAQAVWTLSRAMRTVPPDDKSLLPKLRSLVASVGPVVPTPENPVTMKQPMQRVALTFQLMELDRQPVQAHPAAKAFPGSPPQDAKPVTRTFSAPFPTKDEWVSTGLYAAPGAKLKVKGVGTIIIGPHTDELWHKESWPRVPSVSRRFKFEDGQEVASPFGGLVYLTAVKSASVTITGAVEAPYYRLGETTDAEWKRQRENPGPWAELQSEKVIVTVPSKEIRNLDDPEALMRFWDQLISAEEELVGAAGRNRRERLVPDVLISAGYMHSGYPIMTHMDAAPRMVDLKVLQTGEWGFLHELGHNLQSPHWTFDGTGEVTNNFLVLYALETVCGRELNAGHPALKESPKKLEDALKAGKKPWAEDDPFLRLYMYYLMRRDFGWEPFKKVFREYLAPGAVLPRSDLEKRDQWMVRVSKAVGRNLGPYFIIWGVETSEAARASVANLPLWMPPEWEGAELLR